LRGGNSRPAANPDAHRRYISPPTVQVPGYVGTRARAELKFGEDLKTNGSITVVKLEAEK
jgi:hypothetical protein